MNLSRKAGAKSGVVCFFVLQTAVSDFYRSVWQLLLPSYSLFDAIFGRFYGVISELIAGKGYDLGGGGGEL